MENSTGAIGKRQRAERPYLSARYLIFVLAWFGVHSLYIHAQTCKAPTAVIITLTDYCGDSIGPGGYSEWELGYESPVNGSFIYLGDVVGDNICPGEYVNCSGELTSQSFTEATIKSKSSTYNSTEAIITFTVTSHPIQWIQCTTPCGTTGDTLSTIPDTGVSTFYVDDCS
jgi:hypothetical protein